MSKKEREAELGAASNACLSAKEELARLGSREDRSVKAWKESGDPLNISLTEAIMLPDLSSYPSQDAVTALLVDRCKAELAS